MKTRHHLSSYWTNVSQWMYRCSSNPTAQRGTLFMALLALPVFGLHHVDVSTLETLVRSALHMLSTAPFQLPQP